MEPEQQHPFQGPDSATQDGMALDATPVVPPASRASRQALSSGTKPARDGDRSLPDPYQLVSDRITAALEAGTIPWKKPWAAIGGVPRNLASGRPYRGMNVLLLSLGHPYGSPWWLTYRQAQELGGQVRKGEKASLVTFWKFPEGKQDPEEDAPSEPGLETGRGRPPPLLRHYHVFNVEQCEGLEAPPSAELVPKSHERLALCEEVVAGMPQAPRIQRDPRTASYAPGRDVVGIPDLTQFESPEGYYATLFHELVHSTGHPTRLRRFTPSAVLAPFGSPDYGREELIAELGAAFLCARTGLLPRTLDNTAAYIQGWLGVLKGDKRLLPVAAAQAQKAADFILDELRVPAQRDVPEEHPGREERA